MNKTEMMLIVDDNEINRMLLDNIFSGDYRILEAENGQEAMEKLIRYKDSICAVLLDVVMPVMDGMEVLEKLKMMGGQSGCLYFSLRRRQKAVRFSGPILWELWM